MFYIYEFRKYLKTKVLNARYDSQRNIIKIYISHNRVIRLISEDSIKQGNTKCITHEIEEHLGNVLPHTYRSN